MQTEVKMKIGIYERFFKRIIDFILSLIAVICLLPVFLIVSIIIRCKLGTPIFFVQERIGKDDKLFKMLKFRSMSMERDENGDLLPDVDRIGAFGLFLRSTSIDELPALLNVLKGDMSLIGPRPLPTVYLPYFTTDERKRHNVRGGLSGLAQVNGRNALTWEQRFLYDIEYVSNITFFGDLSILYKTVIKVLNRSDIGLRGVTGPGDLDVCRASQADSQK